MVALRRSDQPGVLLMGTTQLPPPSLLGQSGFRVDLISAEAPRAGRRTMPDPHEPVMVDEVLRWLLGRLDGAYIDGTGGTGGHTRAILDRVGARARVAFVEQDPDALEMARARLGDDPRLSFHRTTFSELDSVLASLSIPAADGVLLDLGLNAWSLARPETGLSYSTEGPLRMRLDPDLPLTAAQYLARVRADELRDLFSTYGESRRAVLYARRIVTARERTPLATTFDLVRALAGPQREALSTAELSRLFAALRIAINQEMERLDAFLRHAGRWIVPGGRLVVISYASHEDRLVKRALVQAKDSPFVALHPKPLVATPAEVARNRKARSARLRAFERRREV